MLLCMGVKFGFSLCGKKELGNIAAARVRARVRSCLILYRQSDTRAGLLGVLLFLFAIVAPTALRSSLSIIRD
jgi:hypothetical protein